MLGSAPCPCGRGETYADCCEPLHIGSPASTAERLMRSRYSAFALGLDEYLSRSWHASKRRADREFDETIEWRRLVIESTEAGGPFDASGYVTFTAIGRNSEGRFEQRERSNFVREGGHWFYVDGEML